VEVPPLQAAKASVVAAQAVVAIQRMIDLPLGVAGSMRDHGGFSHRSQRIGYVRMAIGRPFKGSIGNRLWPACPTLITRVERSTT
jgi:hypothetical protein